MIQGREVHLRPLADEDAAAMLSIFGDPEVMRFVRHRYETSR